MSARAARRMSGVALVALLAATALPAHAQPAPGATKAAPATGAPAPKAPAGKAEAQDPENQPTLADDKDVIEASGKWLKLIDSARYGAAWDLAARSLKSTAPRKTFVDGIAAARKTYGKMAERKPAQFARAHSMPGGPEGDYALVSFETRFASGKTADEQVVWFLEPDAVWRVAGYYIR